MSTSRTATGLFCVLLVGTLLPLPGQDQPRESLVFATYPFGDAESIFRAFSPLVEYLAEETDRSIRLVVTRDYQELSDRLADGTVDIAWIGSANYVKTRRAVPDIRYLATYLERDVTGEVVQPYYRSVILTLAASEIHSLSDLAGKRFGFTSPDSTSGYYYPRMVLLREGLDPETFFGSVFFLGRHGDVINALLAGSLDGGTVSDGTYYNAVAGEGERFRVLAWSEPIPLDAVVAAAHLDSSLAGTLRTALTAIPEHHRTNRAIREHLGWNAAGFTVQPHSFYDSVERALGEADRP
jgi:phosphonate transport system substrate-binding protein